MTSFKLDSNYFQGPHMRHLNNSTWFLWPDSSDFSQAVELSDQMQEWCMKNCKGKYEVATHGLFIFDDNEAMRFKLIFG